MGGIHKWFVPPLLVGVRTPFQKRGEQVILPLCFLKWFINQRGKTMNLALKEGMRIINDSITIEIKKRRIPVVIISDKGHSCDDPENCRLNTTLNPFWCMTVNDKGEV